MEKEIREMGAKLEKVLNWIPKASPETMEFKDAIQFVNILMLFADEMDKIRMKYDREELNADSAKYDEIQKFFSDVINKNNGEKQ